MYCNVEKVSLIATVITIVAAIVGFVIGASVTRQVYRDEAVRHRVAEYAKVSGIWHWRIDLREPLRNRRNWIICPSCNGLGELNLEEYIGDDDVDDPTQPTSNQIQQF